MLHKVQRQDENQLRESLSPGHCSWPIKDRHSLCLGTLPPHNEPTAGWRRRRLSPFFYTYQARLRAQEARDRGELGRRELKFRHC